MNIYLVTMVGTMRVQAGDEDEAGRRALRLAMDYGWDTQDLEIEEIAGDVEEETP